MKHPWQGERGVVAIEMAIVLTLGIFMLAAVILIGRLTWHAIAVQKAVSSAGRIVAALPYETLTLGGVNPVLGTLASDLVHGTTATAGLDIQPDWIVVHCIDSIVGGCGRQDVNVIRIGASLRFTDTVFGASVTELPATDVDLAVTYFQTYVH